MKSRLTSIQVDYVLDHINHHVILDKALRQRIAYGQKTGQGMNMAGSPTRNRFSSGCVTSSGMHFQPSVIF
jgi:hypothetical protein